MMVQFNLLHLFWAVPVGWFIITYILTTILGELIKDVIFYGIQEDALFVNKLAIKIADALRMEERQRPSRRNTK